MIWPRLVPLTAACILLDKSSGLCKGRYHLGSTAAVADDTNTFPFVLDGVVPSGSVEHWSLELLHALEFDIAWEGNCTDSRDEDGGVSLICDAAAEILQLHGPFSSVVIPAGTCAFDGSVNMLSEIKFVDGVFHI